MNNVNIRDGSKRQGSSRSRLIRWVLVCVFLAGLTPSPALGGGHQHASDEDVLITAAFEQTQASQQGGVKAIILFIGDGMGAGARNAARWLLVGKNGNLAMDRMPVVGYSKTDSLDSRIPESASSATAMATGTRTRNRWVSMDTDFNHIPTILEHAQRLGWSVGLVTTTEIADATPGAFAAHISNRKFMPEIARQMLMETGVDVILGGGEDEFLPETENGCFPEPGEREDGSNLIAEAQAAGYGYVCNAEQLAQVNPSITSRLLGLFADEGMDRPFTPSLAAMTQKAIDILSQNPEGFFLMVEGGQIDWAAHDNKAWEAMESTVGLDAAVAVGQAYAAVQPNTLIIVTADHETGGMSVLPEPSGAVPEDGPFNMPDGSPFYVNWTSKEHTDLDVPVTAQGPWSELLSGRYQNTRIFEAMYAALVGEAP